jgi:MoCo/4Fe-4S cofactor protein with predicted Tat translocation signal
MRRREDVEGRETGSPEAGREAVERAVERLVTAERGGASAREEYWRSLDELADTPEFRRFVADEFPSLAEELSAPRSRRSFLKIMGASLSLAGLASCRWPKELVLPFANRPDGRIPGVPARFATAMELGGSAVGLVVTSYDGRPVKVEGNPNHPDSLGAAGSYAQGSVLELYDPDRSRRLIRRQAGQEVVSSWDDFTAFAGEHFATLRREGGKGLAVLAEASSSPTVARLRENFARLYPDARWYEVEAISRDAERVGTKRIFSACIRRRCATRESSQPGVAPRTAR